MAGMSRWLLCAILVVVGARSGAADSHPRPAKALQDNSFLIEEAYNQEPGVVQHIATMRRQNRDWFFVFTQEWPLGSQTHQFSYSIPYTWLRGAGRGLGDIALNYRYQALFETDYLPAFSPRISLLVPSGNASKDLGVGAAGYQINLPFSKIVSDRVTLHANAGLTSYFDVRGRQPVSYNLGGSAIYAVTTEFNLMLESLTEWTETVDAAGLIARETSYTLNPGFRYAFNRGSGQLVLGVAAPVRFTRRARDYGAFFYASFEHGFLK